MNIYQLFYKNVVSTPNNIAIKYMNETTTYGELDYNITRICQTIIGFIEGSKILGIYCSCPLNSIKAILAILKAGCAFLVLDPNYPNERLNFMIQDCNVTTILTDADALLNEELQFKGNIININKSYSPSNVSLTVNDYPCDLAFVIYTSGTTGKPKAVMHNHRGQINVVNFLKSRANSPVACLHFYSRCFIVSYNEIFLPLLTGGILYLLQDLIKQNIFSLLKYIDEEEIQQIFLPNSYFKQIQKNKKAYERIPDTVKDIYVAGEPLIITDEFYEYYKSKKSFSLNNMYGTSEIDMAFLYTVDFSNKFGVNPIGCPINGMDYILMAEDETLIDEYDKTGDVAKRTNINNHVFVELVGRKDNLVKVRGFRIELSEIEYNLLNMEKISNSVVIVIENSLFDKYICAFIESSLKLPHQFFQSYLEQKLPYYMIPDIFIVYKKFPRLPNGKIDKLKLRQSVISKKYIDEKIPEEVKSLENTSKKIEIYEKIRKIIISLDILGINYENLGITKNLFSIGLNSIDLIKLIVEIESFYNFEFNTNLIIENNSITIDDLISQIIDNHYTAESIK